jgi:hypothetical protein
MRLLQIKGKSLSPMARVCVVTFDEMSLRKEIKYNEAKDNVSGLVELPDKLPTACNEALVVMARGLASSWKQPLSYYFSANATPASVLKNILFKTLAALKEAGFTVAACVCDQGSTNRSLYRVLGVTSSQPYIEVITVLGLPVLLYVYSLRC